MISFQSESFIECLDELRPLLDLHWDDLALQKEHVKLSPHHEIYFKSEKDDGLAFITIRSDGKIIGYFIGFIGTGLHYSDCLECQMDIFYIVNEYRGSGLSFKLFEFTENLLKKRGVKRFFAGSKLHKDCGFIFDKMGFEKTEIKYSKWIGG